MFCNIRPIATLLFSSNRLMPLSYQQSFRFLKQLFYSGWKAVEARNNRILFDLESTPLQIRTDSTIGSDEIVRVKSNRKDLAGPAIRIKFQDPLIYTIGRCEGSVKNIPFSPPSVGTHRVWTFSKQNNRVRLLCNGVQIYEFNFSESSLEECWSQWSADFVYIKFMHVDGDPNDSDTASDFYRPLPNSKNDLQIIPLNQLFKWK